MVAGPPRALTLHVRTRRRGRLTVLVRQPRLAFMARLPFPIPRIGTAFAAATAALSATGWGACTGFSSVFCMPALRGTGRRNAAGWP